MEANGRRFGRATALAARLMRRGGKLSEGRIAKLRQWLNVRENKRAAADAIAMEDRQAIDKLRGVMQVGDDAQKARAEEKHRRDMGIPA